jgi:hypothetical protein
MRVATGKVVAGKVIVEGEPLPDGAKVTVIARDDAETFDLSPEDEAEILSAVAEAERGETMDAAQLLETLPRCT